MRQFRMKFKTNANVCVCINLHATNSYLHMFLSEAQKNTHEENYASVKSQRQVIFKEFPSH